MARRQIGQEVFAFAVDPIPHCRSALDRLLGLIDWPSVDRHLVDIYTAAKGEPAWPPLALFRALLLAIWYDLSDVRLAEALEDRASFRRFCGFAAHEPTPERTAFVRFRRELAERSIDTILFDEITRQLKARAITIKTGTLVDATVISSASHRDEEAAWVGHKRRKAIHGFKAHVAADADTALVEELTVTPGNINDGRAGGEVLPDDPGDVYADSAYRGTAFASAVQSKAGARAWSRPACGAGLGAMPYASSGRGTILSTMCAAGSRKSLALGSAATGSDACAGWDWRKPLCRSD